MPDPFIGQIMQFGGNFAPRGWALCDGQLLSISQHQALFSILGTTYGGDGRSTFALPDLRGRVAMHAGHGPGLTNRRLGEKDGDETVTLTTNNLPAHSHSLECHTASVADAPTPANHLLGKENVGQADIYSTGNADATMSTSSIGNTGEGQPTDNMQPYTAVNFIIALEGVFPSRS